MKIIDKFNQTPYLLPSFLSFLLLGVTDTLHHLHAALALGSSSAMHAVWLGVVISPISFLLVLFFVYSGRKFSLWTYLSIAILTIIVSGFYHGGWDHLIKVLGYLRIESESTNISSVFPSDNPHYWIYEIVGSLQFFFGLVVGYFTFRLLRALLQSP